jgi:hypothetical protein
MALIFCEILGFPAGMRNFEGLDPLYGHDREAHGEFDRGTGLAGGSKSFPAYFWNAEAL